MPHYSMAEKITEPITYEQYEKALSKLKPKYQAYLTLIYYTGIRVGEALRLTKESFWIQSGRLYVEIGVREKTRRKLKDGRITKGRKTKPLPLSLKLPHIDVLVKRIQYTRKGQRVFPFVQSTAWRQVHRVGLGYNHRARLSAITFFLKSGRSIADIANWFGIGIQTINSYIGEVELEEMGAMKR